MTDYTCKHCGHRYGTVRPSEPVVALHLAVSHGGGTPIVEVPIDAPAPATATGIDAEPTAPTQVWIVQDWTGKRVFPDETFESFDAARGRISEWANEVADNEEEYDGICEDLYAVQTAGDTNTEGN